MKDSLSHLPSLAERGTLRIAELYASRQGEGKLTGTESVFVRVSGCNLRCWFCDTPHASWNPEGDQISIDMIIRHVIDLKRRHVVITGGEPLLFPNTTALCRQLRSHGQHITIETAGTIVHEIPDCDLMSISPKLQRSKPRENPKLQKLHEQRRWRPEVVKALADGAKDYQLKFVIDSVNDQEEVLRLVGELGEAIDRANVWIMPQARDSIELDQHQSWLKPWVQRHGFNYCDRKQLRWYGSRRGT